MALSMATAGVPLPPPTSPSLLEDFESRREVIQRTRLVKIISSHCLFFSCTWSVSNVTRGWCIHFICYIHCLLCLVCTLHHKGVWIKGAYIMLISISMFFGVKSVFSDVRYSATCNYMNLYRGDLIAFAWSRAEEKIDFICQNNILFLIWFFNKTIQFSGIVGNVVCYCFFFILDVICTFYYFY